MKFRTVIALILIFTSGFSQEITGIQTDRPDQTECPFIVPKKHFQVESGFVYESISNLEKSFAYPSVLWKYGVNDKFELRVITELVHNRDTSIKLTGISPVQIGFKTKLLEERGWIPTTSFIVHAAIPRVASRGLQSSYFAPNFRFTFNHTLGERFSLGYNLGAEWDGEKPDAIFIYTLTSGFKLAQRWNTYIEVFGFMRPGIQDHHVDGGFTFLPYPHMQFDLSAGFGLTPSAPEYYVSVGYSILLPQ